MIIELKRSEGPELFAPEANLDGVDLAASAAAFDTTLVQRILVNLPDATVILAKGRTDVHGAEDEHAVRALIADIIDGLSEETEWITWDGPREGP